MTAFAPLRRTRRLPFPADVLVSTGTRVEPGTVVARAQIPGPVQPVDLGGLLGLEPSFVPAAVKVGIGESFGAGRLLAETGGVFGAFKRQVRAPFDGVLTSVSNLTGRAMLDRPGAALELLAHVPGEVVDVLPREGVVVQTVASVVTGIFGLGGEAHGPLAVLAPARDRTTGSDAIHAAHAGKVLVCGASIDRQALRQAQRVGAAAVVVGGIDYLVALALSSRDPETSSAGAEPRGCVLVVTEGFGEVAMGAAAWELLAARAGAVASVTGGARPEVLVPVEQSAAAPAASPPASLAIGGRVRGLRHPHLGLYGEVLAAPEQPQRLPSEAHVRVLEVRFDDGQRALVPRANLESV